MLLKHNGEAMKAKHIKCLAVLFSAVTVLLVACRKDSFDYGVFIGDDINKQKKYERYDNIVVDPSSFKSKQVETLKADGKNVYAYLNIGSLENAQPYYKSYEDVLLDRYDGWPDEHWETSPTGQQMSSDGSGMYDDGIGVKVAGNGQRENVAIGMINDGDYSKITDITIKFSGQLSKDNGDYDDYSDQTDAVKISLDNQ